MRSCFVALPPGAALQECFEVLARGITAAALHPLLAWELDRPRAFEQIHEGVENATACIVDLTNRAQVPLYVFGLAKGSRKPVIIIAQDASHLPFDVRVRKHIIYRYRGPRWQDMLSMQVQSALRDLMASPATPG
jgi:hypothetical protein